MIWRCPKCKKIRSRKKARVCSYCKLLICNKCIKKDIFIGIRTSNIRRHRGKFLTARIYGCKSCIWKSRMDIIRNGIFGTLWSSSLYITDRNKMRKVDLE